MPATRAPSARKRSAVAAPMPCAAPVIATVLPENRCVNAAMSHSSMEGPAAIYGERDARHIGRLRAGEPQDRRGDLVGSGNALECVERPHRLIGYGRIGGGVDAGAEEGRLDGARADGVDADA